MWLAQGNSAQALAVLRAVPTRGTPATGIPEVGRAELFLTAQAQQGSELDAAQDRLQTWVAEHPLDATAWQLLATTYSAQGRVVNAIRAQAEVNVAQLDYPAALVRFKAAQDVVRKGTPAVDHIEASIVDTRARQVESVIREQALER
jgi:predicted Zn-dependent protease